MGNFLKLFDDYSKYSEYKSSGLKMPVKSHCVKEITLILENDNCFKTVAVTEGTIVWEGSNSENKLYYRLNNGGWDGPYSSVTVSVSSGDEVAWKGVTTPQPEKRGQWNVITQHGGIGYFSGGTSEFDVKGDIMSLLYGDDFEEQRTLSQYAFTELFANSKIRSAKKLNLKNEVLSYSCYYAMFQNCQSLVSAPELPTETLANACYYAMFNGCVNLVDAPELPATTLKDQCYYAMFQNCWRLKNAPRLPALTTAPQCYQWMFSRCYDLETPPELEATDLRWGWNCYAYMFYIPFNQKPSQELGNGITSSPYLAASADRLSNNCYASMFYGTNVLPNLDKSIFETQSALSSGGLHELFAGTKVTDSDLYDILPINPETGKYWLPVTNLYDSCYWSMFQYCWNLDTPPELPATTLASNCYGKMFLSNSIRTAPELPATTLANGCYQEMFSECYNLEESPVLPAETLTPNCYQYMFQMKRKESGSTWYNDTKLKKITCLATDITANNCTLEWVNNVSPDIHGETNGVFVKSANMNDWAEGINGVPSGWSVENNT